MKTRGDLIIGVRSLLGFYYILYILGEVRQDPTCEILYRCYRVYTDFKNASYTSIFDFSEDNIDMWRISNCQISAEEWV